MKSGTNELTNTLNSVITEVERMSTPTIKESEFKKDFLPIVLAIYNHDSPVLTAWVYRSGSVFNGFIVEADNSTEVLFTTPGIYVKASFEVAGGLTSLMTDLGQDQKLKLDTAGTYAKHLNADNAKLRLEDSGAHHIEWYRILSRYGYKMKNVTKAEPHTIPLAPTAAPTKPAQQLDWGDDEFA